MIDYRGEIFFVGVRFFGLNFGFIMVLVWVCGIFLRVFYVFIFLILRRVVRREGVDEGRCLD